MSAHSTLLAVAAQQGGVLLRVEFLDATGDLASSGGDHLVAARDLRLTSRSISFFWAHGDRVHAHALRSVERDGDDWILTLANPTITIVIGPLWLDEHREALAEWLTRPQSDSLRDELDDLARTVGQRAPAQPAKAARQRRYQARWYARLGHRARLEDAGVLVLGPRGALRFFAMPSHLSAGPAIASDVEAALRAGCAPTEVFGYFSGNGQSNEWSKPSTLFAPSIEVAASRLLADSGFAGARRTGGRDV